MLLFYLQALVKNICNLQNISLNNNSLILIILLERTDKYVGKGGFDFLNNFL